MDDDGHKLLGDFSSLSKAFVKLGNKDVGPLLASLMCPTLFESAFYDVKMGQVRHSSTSLTFPV